jgi:hypothetical protein
VSMMQPGHLAAMQGQERREEAARQRENIEREIANRDQRDLLALHERMQAEACGWSTAELHAAQQARAEADEVAGTARNPSSPPGSVDNPERMVGEDWQSLSEGAASRSSAWECDQLFARAQAGDREFELLRAAHASREAVKAARSRRAEIHRLESELAMRDRYDSGGYYQPSLLDYRSREITRTGDW